jgi:selenide,water dikinase
MGPRALAQVLRPLAQHGHPNLLVGLQSADDAAVWKLSEDQAVIQTVDFFPPIVDDPFDYGRIAAANSMSDVFAMGGEVALALNVAGFPEDFPADVMAAIFEGGDQKVREAGGVIAGGHTVTDAEPKYGLSVTGLIHPARILRKGALRLGDVLVLTKPLGTGAITTALRAQAAHDAHVTGAVASMTQLNQRASRAAVERGLVAATDITGFGLLGHAAEMALASHVHIVIEAERVPLLEGARTYARDGFLPGGLGRNRDYFAQHVTVNDDVEADLRDLLFDPETSGGLLLGVPEAALPDFAARMRAHEHAMWEIGVVDATLPADVGQATSVLVRLD